MLKRVTIKCLREEGEFPCPKCSNVISPDDLSNTNYEIERVNVYGSIVQLLIRCKKCRTLIVLDLGDLEAYLDN